MNSFGFGSSTTNQRIESCWSQFRKTKSTWWINYFKDMIAQNIFNASIVYHVDCLRFCIITLLQKDLDEMKNLWNNHYIRCQTNSECPSGRSNVIHYTSAQLGVPHGAKSVDVNDIMIAESSYKEHSLFGFSSVFPSFAIDIINENNLETPRNIIEPRRLYELLLSKINGF